jgi:hypothetical protein
MVTNRVKRKGSKDSAEITSKTIGNCVHNTQKTMSVEANFLVLPRLGGYIIHWKFKSKEIKT